MIAASTIMGIHEDAFTKLFEVAIQLGAILSVVVLYRRKFLQLKNKQFFLKLLVAVIPALILGFLLGDYIDALLESPTTVGIALVLGGIFFLFVDKIFNKRGLQHEENINLPSAFVVGLFQCIAMIPGVSRSAATIIGGLQQGFSRKVAAEFSFFLAVPTMAAATGYKLLKAYLDKPEILFNKHNLIALAVGNVVAFLVAMLAIKFFISYLQKHGFRAFGWYRIAAGVLLLTLIYSGVISN